jgi:hypothetical protein
LREIRILQPWPGTQRAQPLQFLGRNARSVIAHHNAYGAVSGRRACRALECEAACALAARAHERARHGHRWRELQAGPVAQEPAFEEQIKHFAPCDLLIVEGYKFAPIPKLEVYRAETGEGLLHPKDPHIVAIATDIRVETKLLQLDLNAHEAIAAFILGHLKLA